MLGIQAPRKTRRTKSRPVSSSIYRHSARESSAEGIVYEKGECVRELYAAYNVRGVQVVPGLRLGCAGVARVYVHAISRHAANSFIQARVQLQPQPPLQIIINHYDGHRSIIFTMFPR